MPHDQHLMSLALRLAERGLGTTWPNPSVGCVIVKDDAVIARGHTAKGGRPHAEAVALAQAGEQARGATAYVTLEPCCHHGKTPPCTDALIAAGIARVVVAVRDPYAEVAGKGIERLQQAGIDVTYGVCEQEAARINEGFFKAQTENRPFVTLKLATSLDGKIATTTGESKWITGEQARAYGHRLRSTHDAIMVGIGTVLADNPTLTCRLPGLEDTSPVRVVMDSNLRIPLDAELVKTAINVPTWVLTLTEPDDDQYKAFVHAGVEIIRLDGEALNLSAALKELAQKGITRLLVEGGGKLAASFVRAGLLDEIVWFHAPVIIGNDGIPAIAAMELKELVTAPRFRLEEVRQLGGDVVERYRKGE